tara:strand:- start:1069 stop:1497 length:429 start_codon:yes stop_codon:yes gene_type:complete
MEWVIYLLKDTNNKYYVGKSGGIKSRISKHRHIIKNKGSCSSRGLTLPFECEIVERFNNKAEMDTAEQRHYDLLKAQHGENLLNINRPLNPASQYIEKQRHYYNQHHAELNKKYDCECGGKYTKQHKARHEQSNNHKVFLLK